MSVCVCPRKSALGLAAHLVLTRVRGAVSLIDIIKYCNAHEISGFIPVFCAGQQIGYVGNSLAAELFVDSGSPIAPPPTCARMHLSVSVSCALFGRGEARGLGAGGRRA